MTDHELLLTGKGALPFRFDKRAGFPGGRESVLEIPRVLHFVWIGSAVPAKYFANVHDFVKHNPGWRVNLWVDNMGGFGCGADVRNVLHEIVAMENIGLYVAAANVAEKVDLLRYEIVRDHGGVYLDVDTLSLGPGSLDAMTHAFLTVSGPPWFNTGNAQFGFAQGSEFLSYVIEHANDPRLQDYRGDGNIPCRTGPTFLTTCVLSFADMRIVHPNGRDLLAKVRHLADKNW